jgi:hypothetical protein
LAGAGILSKYNYTIFFLALIITATHSLQYRKTVIAYRSLVSVGVAMLFVAPHGIWVLTNMDIATSSVHKFSAIEGHYLSGTIEVVISLLSFLTPLWIIGILLIKDRPQLLNSYYKSERSLILNLFVITMAIVLLLVVVSGAQNIKSRWYQPLLFYIPLLLALTISPSQKNLKIYCAAGIFIFVTIAVVFPVRILFAENFGNKARPNLPYQAQARDLAKLAGDAEIILSESNLIGGNMRLFFKNAEIITPEYDRQLYNQKGTYLILCETKNCKNRLLRRWLLSKHNIDINFLKFNQLETSYNYIPKRKHIFYWAKVESVSD